MRLFPRVTRVSGARELEVTQGAMGRERTSRERGEQRRDETSIYSPENITVGNSQD